MKKKAIFCITTMLFVCMLVTGCSTDPSDDIDYTSAIFEHEFRCNSANDYLIQFQDGTLDCLHLYHYNFNTDELTSVGFWVMEVVGSHLIVDPNNSKSSYTKYEITVNDYGDWIKFHRIEGSHPNCTVIEDIKWYDYDI